MAKLKKHRLLFVQGLITIAKFLVGNGETNSKIARFGCCTVLQPEVDCPMLTLDSPFLLPNGSLKTCRFLADSTSSPATPACLWNIIPHVLTRCRMCITVSFQKSRFYEATWTKKPRHSNGRKPEQC